MSPFLQLLILLKLAEFLPRLTLGVPFNQVTKSIKSVALNNLLRYEFFRVIMY